MYALHVLKMHCGGCARSVTRAVLAIDSAARVDVDLPSKTVRVATTAGMDAVKSAIVNAGFPVTAISDQ